MILYLGIGVIVLSVLYAWTNVLGMVLGYLGLGVGWYQTYWLGKPVVYRGPVSPAFLIILWPLASLYAIYEDQCLLNHPQRFTVLYGDTGESSIIRCPSNRDSFASWEKAIAFARQEAAKSGYDVTVHDMANYGVVPLSGEVGTAMYTVSPSGEIKRDI